MIGEMIGELAIAGLVIVTCVGLAALQIRMIMDQRIKARKEEALTGEVYE